MMRDTYITGYVSTSYFLTNLYSTMKLSPVQIEEGSREFEHVLI